MNLYLAITNVSTATNYIYTLYLQVLKTKYCTTYKF